MTATTFAAMDIEMDRPGSRVRRWGFDAAVAGALVIVGQVELWGNAAIRPHAALGAPFYFVMATALSGRRSRPLLSQVVVFVAGATALITGVPLQEMLVPVFAFAVAAYSVAAYGSRRDAKIGLAVAVGVVSATILVTKGFAPGDLMFGNFQQVIAWGAGRSVWRRIEVSLGAERQLLESQHQAEATAHDAVAGERRRIARELHDIVSHGLSLMIIQASAAELCLDRDPSTARAPMVAVQDAGRQALVEMQRLLGLLREEDDPGDDLVPQPSLLNVEQLLAQFRRAGLAVDFQVEGPAWPVPAGVGICAYRVLQEALTNACTHAPAAPTRAVLRYRSDGLDVEVVNDGAVEPSPVKHGGAGHGLLGMRERVALFSGRLEYGPTSGGGFAVHASIPALVT